MQEKRKNWLLKAIEVTLLADQEDVAPMFVFKLYEIIDKIDSSNYRELSKITNISYRVVANTIKVLKEKELIDDNNKIKLLDDNNLEISMFLDLGTNLSKDAKEWLYNTLLAIHENRSNKAKLKVLYRIALLADKNNMLEIKYNKIAEGAGVSRPTAANTILDLKDKDIILPTDSKYMYKLNIKKVQ
jgi:DNA-binding transcriptional ArsR family regulator